MIHELIDLKRKTTRSSTTRHLKTGNDQKIFPDCIGFEQSDCENKEVEFSSTTFIPPWLRNSLGLNQRNNQSHTASEQKPGRIIPRYKEPSHNEFDSLKPNIEQDCCPADLSGSVSKNCPAEATIVQVSEDIPSHGKHLSVLWNAQHRESETDSKGTNVEGRSLRGGDSKMTSIDMMPGLDVGRLKDEEKRRLRFNRQRTKTRRRTVNDPRLPDLGRNEIDFLLELKAREVLSNYMKKDVHSVSSDMKQLEAKLILLSAKCQTVNSKLSPQELRLLQEIKAQAGSKEDFQKLVEHVKEINLKEILKSSDQITKTIGGRMKKFEDREERSVEDGKFLVDKNSHMSTDDETDIKRFSEFLSKNKNQEEKRKCLEEVRNYFERKRRTRLTKRRCADDAKTPRDPELTDRKDETSKERQKPKEVYTMPSARNRKSKLGLCDQEVVEKAVNETLQKFVDLYHFHVTPSVMSCMRKKILHAIQSDSFESGQFKRNPGQVDGQPKEEPKRERAEDGEKSAEGKEKVFAYPVKLEKTLSTDTLSSLAKEAQKRTFQSAENPPEIRGESLEREFEGEENENLKRLKKEFENFLNSIQVHGDVRGLKLQSVILEKEQQSSTSKSLQFVYNFTKKVLDQSKIDSSMSLHALRESTEIKSCKESGTQTCLRSETKRNAKIQTNDFAITCEQSLQTEEKTYMSSDAQTESDVNVKELKGVNITPGLYRMVKSKEPGRFFLYPEKLDKPSHDQGPRSPGKGKAEGRKESKKPLSRDKLSRERRIFYRDRERGRLRRLKRGHIVRIQSSKGNPAKKKDDAEDSTIRSSINCLYFRNLNDPTDSFTSKKEEGMMFEDSGTVEDAKETAKEELPSCAWLWNGERITPGCDLKTHVEDLLREKLKEMAASDLQTKFKLNDSSAGGDETLVADRSRTSQKKLEINDKSGIFCFRRSDRKQKEPFLLTVAYNDRNKSQEGEKAEDEEGQAPVVHEKTMKDVGTQNSQQTFLSLSVSKMKFHSNTNTAASRMSKKKRRKNNVLVRPAREPRENVVQLKKAAEIIRAVREMKKKCEAEGQGCGTENTLDTGSTGDGSSSCSTSPKAYNDDALSLFLGLKSNLEGVDFPKKDRPRKTVGFVDHEVQTNEAFYFGDDNSVESHGPGLDSLEHWELIESVLTRVNRKERESLWNDVRDFVKTKIGRDINTDGAREVCIEIEQDLPKAAQGRTRPAVMARGHYIKNEGDVEVEIDLTLDDLERILRHRQRKIRRRHRGRRRTRRLVSSSSAQSDLTKDNLRKYEKYVERFKALGGFVKDKDLKVFKKSKEN